jgi:hypothetical protein
MNPTNINKLLIFQIKELKKKQQSDKQKQQPETKLILELLHVKKLVS